MALEETNFHSQELERPRMIKKSSNKKSTHWLKKMGKCCSRFSGWKIVLLLVVVIGLLYLLWPSLLGFGLSGHPQKWQAVFLTNGQVYFGKIIKETSRVMVLKDVHYLQTEPPKPAKEGEETPQQPGLSVVKLGQEIHQPENRMRINKEHILFTEDLRPDSQVVRVIVEAEKNK